MGCCTVSTLRTVSASFALPPRQVQYLPDGTMVFSVAFSVKLPFSIEPRSRQADRQRCWNLRMQGDDGRHLLANAGDADIPRNTLACTGATKTKTTTVFLLTCSYYTATGARVDLRVSASAPEPPRQCEPFPRMVLSKMCLGRTGYRWALRCQQQSRHGPRTRPGRGCERLDTAGNGRNFIRRQVAGDPLTSPEQKPSAYDAMEKHPDRRGRELLSCLSRRKIWMNEDRSWGSMRRTVPGRYPEYWGVHLSLTTSGSQWLQRFSSLLGLTPMIAP